METGKILRVVWSDHHASADDDWWDIEVIVGRAKRGRRIMTIGELIYEDDRCLVLAAESSYGGDGSDTKRYRRWTSIQKPLIHMREVVDATLPGSLLNETAPL